MTPFLQLCLQYLEHLHLDREYHQFWCSEIPDDLCAICPHKNTNEHCNTLSDGELAYIQTNLPELFV